MESLKKTYITKMPDKAGAFLAASRIICKNGGNIVRVNYNKSVDAHTLFIEVNAKESEHKHIWNELSDLGYLTEAHDKQKVILIVLKLLDVVGSVTPVLEIINNYDINVTYISSQETGTAYQYFKMGLRLTKPDEVKNLLEDISRLCEVKIIDYDNIPLHTDEKYAKGTHFGRLIAPGVMSFMAVWAKYLEVDLFGEELIAGKSTKIEWFKPVFADDILTGKAEVTKLTKRSNRNGLAELTIYAYNQHGELVLTDVTEAIVKCR